MGKENWHVLSNINEDEKSATCRKCGKVAIQSHGKRKTGKTRWRCAVRMRERENRQYNKGKAREYRTQHVSHSGCECCKINTKYSWQYQTDHIIPLYLGGEDILHNYQILCRNCHAYKTHKIDAIAEQHKNKGATNEELRIVIAQMLGEYAETIGGRV